MERGRFYSLVSSLSSSPGSSGTVSTMTGAAAACLGIMGMTGILIAPLVYFLLNFLYRKYPMTKIATIATMLKILNGDEDAISWMVDRFR